MSSLFWTLGRWRNIYSDLLNCQSRGKKNIGHCVLTQSFCSKVNINHFHSYFISQSKSKARHDVNRSVNIMLPQGETAKGLNNNTAYHNTPGILLLKINCICLPYLTKFKAQSPFPPKSQHHLVFYIITSIFHFTYDNA